MNNSRSRSRKKRSMSRSMSRSYRPTINRDLIEVKSKIPEIIYSCKLTPLEIKIGNNCYSYLNKKTQTYKA